MSELPYTKEDAEFDYQMSIDHPICTVCRDSGFVNKKPCSNCNNFQSELKS